ncbi:hypothetical protein [Marinobacter sp. bablab_jr008]|uniref:hypothetical protein n=1 Tax=Marinobacter sp. bablab_jr008 TaxID=2755064 RepID=UPI0018F18DF1|nr:hypothetical protein [Marinobacter sp. bablab_jr008]MEC9386974.1 hypothetical protein [Pseudomonadota bacterium]
MADWKDDDTIKDDEGLLRRVPNWPNMVKFDENKNEYRPSSACFSDKSDGVELSVTLETPLLENGSDHQSATKTKGFGLARVKAGIAREITEPKQCIMREPTDDDPYHGIIAGKKSKRAKQKLARSAELVIAPSIQAPEQQ